MKVLMPESVEQACAMMAERAGGGGAGDLVPLAGATDLLVHWPVRPAEQEKTYLDLSGIAPLRRMEWSEGALTLGALTTYWDVITDVHAAAEFPLLIEAARQVGAVQIQSRGTWAGNVGNGSPAADGVPVLMAYDAGVTLTSSAGSRAVPLSGYYTGYRKSVRRPDEIITSVTIPRRKHDVEVFHKVGPRRAQAITKVGVAIAHEAGAADRGWRVVANSVAPTVQRCPGVERVLAENSTIRSPEDLLPAVNSDVVPIDDIRSTADYRRTVLCRLIYHSVKGRCPGVA